MSARLASIDMVVWNLLTERTFCVSALDLRSPTSSATVRSNDRDFQRVTIIVSDMERAWKPPLFLGIDQTAIDVTNTQASTRFYELLGLSVRGHSNNYDVEQERLSGLKGAHVMITAVRFAGAPGVEFLNYVSPPATGSRESAPLAAEISTRPRLIAPNAVALRDPLAHRPREQRLHRAGSGRTLA